MDLVLFGIQGSGKGTQAKRLAAEFDYDIFEAGGELRKIAALGSALGLKVKSFIDAGRLVPHEIIMQVVREAILQRPRTKKILFDGIPRDTDQQRDFDKVMSETGRDFICVQILISDEEAVHRILGRAQHEGRADDAKEETIRRRMETFKAKTLPVIEQYSAKGKVTEIDGERDMDAVYEDLRRIAAQG